MCRLIMYIAISRAHALSPSGTQYTAAAQAQDATSRRNAVQQAESRVDEQGKSVSVSQRVQFTGEARAKSAINARMHAWQGSRTAAAKLVK